MLTRRQLLTSGIVAGIISFTRGSFDAAGRKRLRLRHQIVGYLPEPRGTRGKAGVFTIYVGARGLDLKRLRQAPEPIRLSIPYPQDSFAIEPYADVNPLQRINIHGYTIRTGVFAVYVPIYGEAVDDVFVDVHLSENQGDNVQFYYEGVGEPGRWIPLRRTSEP